ncbi:ABC transporter permease [Pseudalkalibacillus caeni]|nr:ABC transporter permease [Pseudalkalibacillus caeni]
MTEENTLWKQRASTFWNEAVRYLRLIGNSGLLFAVIFTVIFGSYYYSKILKALPENFPGILLMSVVLTFFLVKSPIRTFLKEADLVFLLPMEYRMNAYFRYSLVYSILFQAFIIVLLMVVFGPLYHDQVEGGWLSYPVIIILLILVKGWNLWGKWSETHLPDWNAPFWYVSIRIMASFVMVYLLLKQAPILYLLIPGIGMILLMYFYFNPVQKNHPLKWQQLIKMDQEQSMKFYRFANLFTDVPKLQQSVKPRPVVSKALEVMLRGSSSVHEFLYWKAFARANDYWGIYIRLTVVGIVLMLVIPGLYGILIGLGLIVYLTGVQLSTLKLHYWGNIWLRLYPLREDTSNAFSKVIFLLLAIQSVVLAITNLISQKELVTSFLALFIGLFISYVYGFLLVNNRERMED